MNERMTKERLSDLHRRASEDTVSYPISFGELCAEVRASWAECERLRADLKTAKFLGSIPLRKHSDAAWERKYNTEKKRAETAERERDNLKAALVKRTGASSFEEWAGDWDPTEETPLDYIGRLRAQLEQSERALEAGRQELHRLPGIVVDLDNIQIAVDRLLTRAETAERELAEARKRSENAEENLVALSGYLEGHGKPCYFCGDPIDNLSASPSEWSVGLCHADNPGVLKWHHARCISERLKDTDRPPQPIECTPGSPCCQDETCPAHRAAASRAAKETPACGA